MSKRISFTLPIAPVAKGRPRLGRYGSVFTPQETRAFESRVKAMSQLYRPKEPLTGPLKMRLGFVLKMPMRPKHRLPAVRPDLDNFIKAVTDGLNGVLYADDAQICELWAVKIYDLTQAGPRIEIALEEMAA